MPEGRERDRLNTKYHHHRCKTLSICLVAQSPKFFITHSINSCIYEELSNDHRHVKFGLKFVTEIKPGLN